MTRHDPLPERLARVEERLAANHETLTEIKAMLTRNQGEIEPRVAALEHSRAFFAGVCAAIGAIAGAGVSFIIDRLHSK